MSYSIKDVFTLCAISNLSSMQFNRKDTLLNRFTGFIDRQLTNSSLCEKLNNNWKRIWGPYIYTHKGKSRTVADNSIFAAVNGERDTIILSIAGTNPISLHGWFDEDFSVSETMVWPFAEGPEKERIRVSLGTMRGLMHIIDIAGEDQSLKSFLKEAVKKYPKLKSIAVTGHSLGGPLALCTGLWLHQIRADWLKSEKNLLYKLKIEIYTFAGASAGNNYFADYVENLIKSSSLCSISRYWNKFDIVPYAWTRETLDRAVSIYQPEIPVTKLLKKIQEHAIEITGRQDYRHVYEGEKPLALLVNSDEEDDLPSNRITRKLKEESEKIKKSLKDLLYFKKGPVSEVLNTYRFFRRCIKEHTVAYFKLLDMRDIFEIMFKDQLVKQFFGDLHNTIISRLSPSLLADSDKAKAAHEKLKEIIDKHFGSVTKRLLD